LDLALVRKHCATRTRGTTDQKLAMIQQRKRDGKRNNIRAQLYRNSMPLQLGVKKIKVSRLGTCSSAVRCEAHASGASDGFDATGTRMRSIAD
jgi:hypothetical protein